MGEEGHGRGRLTNLVLLRIFFFFVLSTCPPTLGVALIASESIQVVGFLSTEKFVIGDVMPTMFAPEGYLHTYTLVIYMLPPICPWN